VAQGGGFQARGGAGGFGRHGGQSGIGHGTFQANCAGVEDSLVQDSAVHPFKV
jgi:hypothetical protein